MLNDKNIIQRALWRYAVLALINESTTTNHEEVLSPTRCDNAMRHIWVPHFHFAPHCLFMSCLCFLTTRWTREFCCPHILVSKMMPNKRHYKNVMQDTKQHILLWGRCDRVTAEDRERHKWQYMINLLINLWWMHLAGRTTHQTLQKRPFQQAPLGKQERSAYAQKRGDVVMRAPTVNIHWLALRLWVQK